MKNLMNKQLWVLGLLGTLMISHLAFLGFGAMHCRDLTLKYLEGNKLPEPHKLLKPDDAVPFTNAPYKGVTEQCANSTATFQRAAETYVAILLALMAPLPTK